MKTKTITLQGTEEQISKVQLNSYAFPTEELPKLVEIRVYVVDSFEHNTKHLTDSMFVELAEGLGNVYTLGKFQEEFNYGNINAFTDVIRFITVPLFGA
jgi:hypothetical protein